MDLNPNNVLLNPHLAGAAITYIVPLLTSPRMKDWQRSIAVVLVCIVAASLQSLAAHEMATGTVSERIFRVFTSAVLFYYGWTKHVGGKALEAWSTERMESFLAYSENHMNSLGTSAALTNFPTRGSSVQPPDAQQPLPASEDIVAQLAALKAEIAALQGVKPEESAP